MAQKRVGVVSIGQKPRPDITALAAEILGQDYEVSVVGALDDLTYEEIPQFRDDEYLLMTGCKDRKGERKGVRVTREFLTPHIQKRIDEMQNEDFKTIIVWCAGRFPQFRSRIMVIRPAEVLKGVVEAVFKKGRLGVLYPSKEQLIWAHPEWSRPGVEVLPETPGRTKSREEELTLLADRLIEKKADMVLLNCAGMGAEMKKAIADRTGKPVIQANALTLRVVKELFG